MLDKYFEIENDFKEIDYNLEEQQPNLKIKFVQLFDHLKSITENAYNPKYFSQLMEKERKTFSVYMINRYLSMHPFDFNWILLINEFQKISYIISPESVYKLYSNTFPKEKIFLRYVKESKNKKINEDLIFLLSQFYEISEKESKECIEVLNSIGENGIKRLKEICRKYGKTDKEIEKLIIIKE